MTSQDQIERVMEKFNAIGFIFILGVIVGAFFMLCLMEALK